METKLFYYCELNNMGQRTGNYFSVELPLQFVKCVNGCFYSKLDTVHESGYIEENGYLFTDELQALRASLS